MTDKEELWNLAASFLKQLEDSGEEFVFQEQTRVETVEVVPAAFGEGIDEHGETLEEFEKEKERILAHLDAMKKDIERLERDLGKTEQEVLELS